MASGEELSTWEGSAACKGADPALFSLHEFEGTARDNAFRSENEARFSLALEYCERCPVIKECGDTASRTDHQYTVRGGRTPYSDARPITPGAKAAARKAWEAYRRGETVHTLGGDSWTWFKGLREAHMASTPEVSWPRYRIRDSRGYQRAGKGIPLSHNEASGTHVVIMTDGSRSTRRTIETKHVVWAVPEDE